MIIELIFKPSRLKIYVKVDFAIIIEREKGYFLLGVTKPFFRENVHKRSIIIYGLFWPAYVTMLLQK